MAPNERLRATMLERGLTPTDVAEAVDVDAKTVERWIGGRLPYRQHRYKVAVLLKAEESFLWPRGLSEEQVGATSESEIVRVYPHRWLVPRESWVRLFEGATDRIGILVYSGLFLAEDPGLLALLRDRAKDGVEVRIMLGDPDSDEVAARGRDEQIDEAMAARVRNALVLYRALAQVAGVELREHATVLYNSIYLADEQALVNPHVYGVPAAQAPVLHLRGLAGGQMFSTYESSFERVWDGAQPASVVR